MYEGIILHKAGDCLRYALGTELFCEREKEYDHFAAFTAYFALTEKLKVDSVFRLSMLLHEAGPIKRRESPYQEEFFEALTEIIISDLRKHYVFQDSEELFRILNKEEIPTWVFANATNIVKMFPDICLIGNKVYFITGEECLFIGTKPEQMEHAFDYEDEEERRHGLISTLYSSILGYDTRKGVIYLELKNSPDLYAVYHADHDQEVFYHDKWIGLLENAIPIVVDDGYLSAVHDDKKHRIKKMDSDERYSADGDYVLVKPSRQSKTVFQPYMLRMDGSIAECPYSERMRFLVSQIETDLRKEDELSGFGCVMSGESLSVKCDSLFTLDFLDKLVDAHKECDKKIAFHYKYCIVRLGAFFEKDRDMLDYFYMLGDLSKRLQKKESEFLSEELLLKLHDLNEKKLEAVVSAPELLKEYLLENAFSDREKKGSQSRKKRVRKPQIGSFELSGIQIHERIADPSQVCVLGSSLVPVALKAPGLVSYNLETAVYEIVYPRILSDQEMGKVISAFSLIHHEKYRFYVDERRRSGE